MVVAVVLRDPFTLYPSLQRHQYDAMREYGREALRLRCGCNLTACDVAGFVRAFPNFQSWRLTSPRWLVPPLEHVGHDAMYGKAARLLARIDLVGVLERLDNFAALLCHNGVIGIGLPNNFNNPPFRLLINLTDEIIGRFFGYLQTTEPAAGANNLVGSGAHSAHSGSNHRG